eukprot:3288268-Rhodomonas_salina.2
MHASSAARASRASTSIAITSAMTLSTKVAAFTLYSRVRTRLVAPSPLVESSMRRSVPSTPDLTPNST